MSDQPYSRDDPRYGQAIAMARLAQYDRIIRDQIALDDHVKTCDTCRVMGHRIKEDITFCPEIQPLADQLSVEMTVVEVVEPPPEALLVAGGIAYYVSWKAMNDRREREDAVPLPSWPEVEAHTAAQLDLIKAVALVDEVYATIETLSQRRASAPAT